MDNQKWTLNAVFKWAQRVANGLPSVGLGMDIFEGIEATLKQRQDRIVELEERLSLFYGNKHGRVSTGGLSAF